MGPMQSLISSARAHMAPFAPPEVLWFVRPWQVPNIETTPADKIQVVEDDGKSTWPQIAAQVDRLGSDGHADSSFHVLSWDPYLLTEAGKLDNPERTIIPLHLGAFAPMTPPTPAFRLPSPVRNKPTAAGIGLPEAIELVKKLLAREGHTSEDRALRQTYLRGLMVETDERAKKNPSDIDSVNLVKTVVNLGLAEGWLSRKTRGNQSGTERIWLNSPQPPPAPPILPVPVLAETLPEQHKARIDKGQARTAQMVQLLKDHSLYSPKDIRDYLFEGVRRAMPEGCKKPAGQLLREAAAFAQERSSADGLSFQYWSAARNGVLQMMLLAGVLIDENGTRIRPGIQARGTTVASLQENFEEESEAFLLKFVINELKDVTQRDTTALAHALFKQPPSKATFDQLIDRVDEMFSRFGSRISESDNGSLSVD
jgi:hypothetical protein